MEALLAKNPTPNSAAELRAKRDTGRDGRSGRLLHGYLHKTSNSLCGIKGYASLIADGRQAIEHSCGWARKIIAEVEQLEAVYRSVQDVAFPQQRVPSGSDLGVVVDRAVSRALRRHPRLCLERLDRQAGDLLLPSRDLDLILGEVLANCAEAGVPADTGDANSPSSRVRVRISSRLNRRGRLALSVTDNGIGVPSALVASVTDPFVTTKMGHLGIGLARVDTVMDMYGLHWSIHSTSTQQLPTQLTQTQHTEVCLEVAVPRIGDVPAASPGRER